MIRGAATIHIKTKRSYVHGGTANLIKTVRSNSNQLAYNYARNVEMFAKVKAPVRTGNLKRSIQRTLISPGHHKVTVGAYYGVYVEYGTRYMHAQPFFRPAIELARQKLQIDMRRVFHR